MIDSSFRFYSSQIHFARILSVRSFLCLLISTIIVRFVSTQQSTTEPMALPNGKTTLVDTSQAECFNLSVLKRMDEDILEILYSATHVAVYEFDTSRKSWRRSDIEGTLFLVKRCSAPRFRMIVLNSKRIDNFTEEVDGSLECEVLQTFLLYTKGNNQLYGIWFYDERNCEEFGQYLKRIVKGMPKTSPAGTPRAQASNSGAADFKSEIRNIANQLNTQSSSSIQKPQSSAPQSGESEHLMRLFLQAKERGAPTTTTTTTNPMTSSPILVSTSMLTTPSSNTTTIPEMGVLPGSEVVLSLDPVNSASPTKQEPSSTVKAIVDPGPSSLAAVPLPPDFFKPSSKTPVSGEETILAPDGVNLSIQDSLNGGKGLTLGLNGALEDENLTTTGTVIPSSLARFFTKPEEDQNPLTPGLLMTEDGNMRDRFRQALINLLNNDDVLDVLIAEFRKMGIVNQ